MNTFLISLAKRDVAIDAPSSIADNIRSLFAPAGGTSGRLVGTVTVRNDGAGRFSIASRHGEPARGLARDELLVRVLDEVGRSLIFDLDAAAALHAAAVLTKDGRAILIPGATGAGKSTLAAWLVERGMDYLSDEIVLLGEDARLWPFRRALVAKPGSREVIEALSWVKRRHISAAEGASLIISPPAFPARETGLSCALILFPAHEAGAGVGIESLSPAQTALRLMECNLNARNLGDHGFERVRDLSVRAPAVRVRYGEVDDIVEIVDELVVLLEGARQTPAELHRLLSAFRASPGGKVETVTSSQPEPGPIPAATPKRPETKWTIGMATYDDYDGVYFTIQALRLYHSEGLAEAEFVVVDNNPTGRCAQALKELESWIPNYRYVPRRERSGTAIRDAIFEEASGTYVLCLDCHVFLAPGALRRLVGYFDEFPETKDIVHGPLLYDDLSTISTHFVPAWRAGMFGTWDKDERGADVNAPGFEIPSQGLGVFACRRDAWVGFNPDFRGFGGEEGYIHEKFRRAGRRAICLPFLRWMHRFARPFGTPYPNTWDDRIRNYMIGFTELALDTAEMEAHFKELLGEAVALRIFEGVKQELRPRLGVEEARLSAGLAAGPGKDH